MIENMKQRRVRILHHHARAIAMTVAAACAVTLSLTAPTGLAQSVKRNLDDLDGWKVVEEPTPGTPEYGIYEIRRALADGRFSEAESKADHWIDAHPRHSLLAEAYLARGQAKEGREDHYKALFDYEFVARSFTGSDAFTRAMEREFAIAKMFANGKRRKLWGIRFASAKDEAEELFIRIQERMPGSELAERAGRALADFYYQNRDMNMAATAYDLYIRNYPDAQDRDEAMKQLVYSNVGKSKGPEFDPSGLYEADAWLETIDRAYPAEAEQMGADALRVRIRESDADRMLEDAKWYLKRKDEVSARFILKRLLRKYASTASGQIAYRFMADKGWIGPKPKSEPAAATQGEPTADESNASETETQFEPAAAETASDHPAK